MDVRLALISLLKQVLAGGEITEGDLSAIVPDPIALENLERVAWQRLSQWADDGDIRAKGKAYAEMRRRQIGDALGDLEALEAGYNPREILWGEHQSTRIPVTGCLAVVVVLAVFLYAVSALGIFIHGDR